MEQLGMDKPLDEFVMECRSILMKHSVTPVQKEYAELAAKGK